MQYPKLINAPVQCHADAVPFVPDSQGAALVSALTELTIDQTPDIANVGALFANHIEVRCG